MYFLYAIAIIGLISYYSARAHKLCPFCKSYIDRKATVCLRCHRDLSPRPPQ
jgi:predicted amidophosphoribosyltransferase